MTKSKNIGRGRKKGSTNIIHLPPGQQKLTAMLDRTSGNNEDLLASGKPATRDEPTAQEQNAESSRQEESISNITYRSEFMHVDEFDDDSNDSFYDAAESFDDGADETVERIKIDSAHEIYFQSIKNRLTPTNTKEYNNGTFWVLPKDNFFTLRDSSDPANLYKPRVLLWFPHQLIEKGKHLKCPKCSSKLRSDGSSAARRVVDVEE